MDRHEIGPDSPRKPAERGFVLIAMSVSMLLMLAVMGLAFDFGRIYIARNEAQVFTDAAAMAAALKIDGTAAGLARAREAVAAVPMRWNLGTKEFTGVIVEFSSDGAKWEKSPVSTPRKTTAPMTSSLPTSATTNASSKNLDQRPLPL